MPAIPWWAWSVLAAGVAFAELHVPGSYLIWIALGAAVTAAVDAVWGLSLTGQLGTFAVASALSCVAGYFVYRGINRSSADETPLNQRRLSLVGAHGVVCAALVQGRGKVRLADSVWLAEGPDLPEGAPIVVKSVRGTWAIVEAADAARAAGAAGGKAAG
jgi:membrane protein implicated in regulation of membrane protease activity